MIRVQKLLQGAILEYQIYLLQSQQTGSNHFIKEGNSNKEATALEKECSDKGHKIYLPRSLERF